MLHLKPCGADESQPASTEWKEWKKKERERLICEVTLLAWPPSKILSVAMKSEASEQARARVRLLKTVAVGAEEREEMKGARMRGDVLHPRRSRP